MSITEVKTVLVLIEKTEPFTNFNHKTKLNLSPFLIKLLKDIFLKKKMFLITKKVQSREIIAFDRK